MRLAATLALLAVAAVLGLAACGGDDDSGSTTTTTVATATDDEAETTTEDEDEDEGEAATGDAAAGRTVFDTTGCGSCHILEAADATGTVGPSLGERLAADAEAAGEELADFTRDSIEDPDEYVAEGYAAGTMPSFDEQLSDEQLDDLVAFIVQSVR